MVAVGVRAGAALHCLRAILRTPDQLTPWRSRARVDWILAVGQVTVCIAMMASILLQVRGAGLGAAFGGDSSVYRSRRGIEKRLYQFTIALGVLFVIFSVANYMLNPTAS
jgi:preprotein translocase subunit SecG